MLTYRAGQRCPKRPGTYDLVCCSCRQSLHVLTTLHPGRGEVDAAQLLESDPGSDLAEALRQHARRCSVDGKGNAAVGYRHGQPHLR